MKMEEIKLNLENLSKEERKQLMKLVEKANKPKTGRWKPNHGDRYWFIMDCSNGYYVTHSDWDSETQDNQLYENHILYETKEKAEFAAEKKKIERELELFACTHDQPINWTDLKQLKYYFYFDYENEKIWVDFHCRHNAGEPHFSSKELCWQAIKEIGEERLKKYYFGVE